MRRNLYLFTFVVAALALIAVAACVGPLAPAAQQQAPASGASAPGSANGNVPAVTNVSDVVPSGAFTTTNLSVSVVVSKPANGQYLVAGEKSVVTMMIAGKGGAPLTKDDFATLNLYAYGPQEPTKTVTAVKLLNASTDRSRTPHHYIDLLKDANVKIQGNTWTYELQPVSNEDPGTYTAAVYAIRKGDSPIDQIFALTDFQVGTGTAEKQIVDKSNCASCHQGASNGQFYLHHTQISATNAYGSPSRDLAPVRSCKACHNNDGYAAYGGDITKPTGPTTGVSTPDPIIRRVHGIHNGADLKNTFNTDPKTGNFKDYIGVEFPADIKNCTTCHVDDRWKTQPSREACGACHDNIWFGDTAGMPKTFKAHPGGPQADDKNCATCHTPDNGNLAVATVHNHAVNVDYDQVDIKLSPPANGKFYVAGEKPVVTMVIKDSSGKPIDHTKVDTLLSTASFFVYGPREGSKPVLTTAARLGNSKAYASVTSSIAASGTTTKGWTFADGDTFKIGVDGAPAQVLNAPSGLQTPEQVVAWLKSVLPNATVTTAGGNVTIRSNIQGDKSRIEIYNSPVTTIMGWKPAGLDIKIDGQVVGKTSGVTVEPYVNVANVSTAANNLLGTSDPAAKKTADSITYQLDDVTGLKPGTYMAYMYTNSATEKTKNGWVRAAFGLTTFQIGTETPDPKIATNCAQCHKDNVMHLNESHVHPAKFDPDNCKACHDYNRSGTGNGFAQTGGNSTSGWSGYGAKPIVARVHNVHFGAYLSHPEDVYAGNPNMAIEIVFPQDVRNCVVCHDPKGSPAWKEQPSRLACMACHDTDSDQAHAKANTIYADPADEWSSKNVESCKTCHGQGKEFAVDKVHNIANPYKPPYPRDPEAFKHE